MLKSRCLTDSYLCQYFTYNKNYHNIITNLPRNLQITSKRSKRLLVLCPWLLLAVLIIKKLSEHFNAAYWNQMLDPGCWVLCTLSNLCQSPFPDLRSQLWSKKCQKGVWPQNSLKMFLLYHPLFTFLSLKMIFFSFLGFSKWVQIFLISRSTIGFNISASFGQNWY